MSYIHTCFLTLGLLLSIHFGSAQNTARLQQAKDNIHFVAELSEKSAVENTIEVIYKLHFPLWIGLKNFKFLDLPEYQKFKTEVLPITNYDPVTEAYNQNKSRNIILKRYLLFSKYIKPSDIEPITIQLLIELPTEQLDSLGVRVYEQVPIEVTSKTE
ncbi:MAG: hypothetical protein AAGC43_00125 [Bacteroidota bacterium]